MRDLLPHPGPDIAAITAMSDPAALPDPLKPRLPPEQSPLRVPDMTPGDARIVARIQVSGNIFRVVPRDAGAWPRLCACGARRGGFADMAPR